MLQILLLILDSLSGDGVTCSKLIMKLSRNLYQVEFGACDVYCISHLFVQLFCTCMLF